MGKLHGQPLRQSLLTTDWYKAERIVEDWERGIYASKRVECLADAIGQFQRDAEGRGLRKPTLKKYRILFDRLQAWCAENHVALLADLTPEALRAFRESWSLSSGITWNKNLERLRAFCGFCVDSGWMEKNPAKAVKRSTETHLPTLSFSTEEVDRIMEAADAHCEGKSGPELWNAKRLRALVLVLRWTGLRISDAVMLRVDQIQGNTILLPYQVKTRVVVRVPIPAVVLEALEEIRTSDGTHFFAPGAGMHETRSGNWRRRLRWLFQKAGIEDGHAHRFRDTIAVELLESGVPTERVSILLGHTSTRTTERHYSPWVKSRQDQLEKDMARIWKKAKKEEEEKECYENIRS
ncbi:MAG: tyrosine-type recombinase/integrase [Acidobacteria bacterium]|nr:tyrosine-type recombinase/integrase [Acidobacteriota bacterium]